ncbi:hypothetical protein [Serratia fonticola]|uniref:hypothetical protein n=1 Tax=Serratia fonticola TaxID=47917 RepID=UPI003AB02550
MKVKKQKSVWGIALKAGTIQTTQVFGSRKDAEDAIAKISHLSNGFEAVELGPVNSPALPDGWILIPAKASIAHLKSIACRYRHDFYLLDDNQKDSALSVARQMYEECSGQGFFTIPAPTTEK